MAHYTVLSNFTTIYVATLCSSSDLISFVSTTLLDGRFLTIVSPVTTLGNGFSVKSGAILRVLPAK
ncbi:hypothetical protein [Thiolapillus sp.]|uniref:hypothetical protein n=1 Tax=Thiolapillus sp. TaxID=2017437 RepID=UPI0025E68D54|nr:hypothetical protein [Thiolapillus sp.]